MHSLPRDTNFNSVNNNTHLMVLCLGLPRWAGTHTHTHNHLRLSGFCPGQPGTRRNIHPLTPIMVINRSLSVSSIYYDPWHPLCSISQPGSLFHNLCPSFLWSTSWPGTLHFISIYFFTQSLSFCSTCPYHRNLFCCSATIMSSNPSLWTFTWNSIL